jgi:Dirigent-like protein
VRKAVALVAVAGTTAALLGWVGAGASSNGDHRQVRNLRLVTTHGYFVDNGASGPSGGDLFGGAGDFRRRGHKVGKFSSACTLSPPVGGQCQATFIRRRGGRIQFAGNIRLQGTSRNRLAIVGGTGKFRRARGDAILQSLNDAGSVQRLHLTILR